MPSAHVPGGGKKGQSHNPGIYVAEKADTSVAPEKLSSKGLVPVAMVEESDVAKGNTDTSLHPGH